MKKILVTGHTGFIGRELISALRGNPAYETIGISRSAGRNLLAVDAFKGLPSVDKIVHLAGSVGVMESWSDPGKFFTNNFLSTLNILEFARISKTPVIYLSSYVYGNPQYLPIDEKHPVLPANPYAQSKRQAEILCEAYAKDFGIPVMILRPFNVYGPLQSSESLVVKLLRQVKENGSIEVNDLRPKRDYLYIDDLISAMTQVIESEWAGLFIYNLGYGKSYSVAEVIEWIVKITGRKATVHSKEVHRPNEIMDCYSDSQQFAKRFNWKPRVCLEEGITRCSQQLEIQVCREKN